MGLGATTVAVEVDGKEGLGVTDAEAVGVDGGSDRGLDAIATAAEADGEEDLGATGAIAAGVEDESG
ncbi:MAG TPA: hypothetical protein VGX03_36870 [Candidatus Binatia bacterium]|nr:hypothetical protein [Candidatus Binatia bacterium]